MFSKFNLVAGILALLLFAHAQNQGWSLFDDVADSHAGNSRGSSRTYHK
jgi:hypothetical protein